MKEYTYIDLFSGPGGLCTGFKSENFKPLIAVEWSDHTVKTYAKSQNAEIYELNYLIANAGNLETVLQPTDKTCLIHGDINKVSNELINEILIKKFKTTTVDVVTGGAPCESFSMAGQRLEDDPRNELFNNIIRIAHAVDCKYVMFENVPGLLTKKRAGVPAGQIKHVFEEFRRPYEDGVYFEPVSEDPSVFKCLAADYGVPQKRERLFIVGCNSKYKNHFSYPKKTHGPGRKFPYISVGEAFSYLPIVKSGEGFEETDYSTTYKKDFEEGKISEQLYEFLKFIYGETSNCSINNNSLNLVTYQKALNHREKMIRRFENIQQGEGMKSAVDRLISEGKKNIVDLYFPNKIYAARNRRLLFDQPSYTVTSHCLDEMIHPVENRQLTPREVARLQSFPDWYVFEGPYVKFHSDPEQDKYEQIGDAIPVLMAKALAKSLYEALEKM
jgi:DNA (cytosine-5)-methyltransferase 1